MIEFRPLFCRSDFNQFQRVVQRTLRLIFCLFLSHSNHKLGIGVNHMVVEAFTDLNNQPFLLVREESILS